MSPITRRHALALGGSSLLLPSVSRAPANWPAGPVTFVVGYAAGGSTDINARELAHVMTPVIGQQIIIDNKGGAAGSIGLRAVANAKPDGQTLFVAVGTNDELFRAEQYAPLFKELNPRITVEVVPDLGHLDMIARDRAGAAIAALWRRLSGESGT